MLVLLLLFLLLCLDVSGAPRGRGNTRRAATLPFERPCFMLVISDLSVRYGKILALDLPGTITYPDHAVVAVLGGNGAGKTTFINAVLGEVPHAGLVSGIDPSCTGVQFQTNSFNPLMRVGELCRLVGVATGGDLGQTLNIPPLLSRRMSSLSGGERQRVTLFLVLSRSEESYIFDEVTTGLDFQTRELMMEIVRERTRGATVLITTHYFEEVEDWATHCLVLDRAKPLFAGLVEDFVTASPHHSLIKVRAGGGHLPDRLRDRARRFPWKSSDRFLIARSSEEQLAMGEDLTRSRLVFEVQPRGLYSAYTIAMSARLSGQEESVR